MIAAELVKITDGRKVVHRGKNSGRQRTVTIDREYRVILDGQDIGTIEYRMLTRETRSKGRRYVNSRWESPGWVYREPGFGISFEAYPSTRKAAVEALVHIHQRKADR